MSPDTSVGPLNPDASSPLSLLRRFSSFFSFFAFFSRFRFSPLPPLIATITATVIGASTLEAVAFAARAAAVRRRITNAAGVVPLSPTGKVYGVDLNPNAGFNLSCGMAASSVACCGSVT